MKESDRNPKYHSRRRMHEDRERMHDAVRKMEKCSDRDHKARLLNEAVHVAQEHGYRLREWMRKEGRKITWKD